MQIGDQKFSQIQKDISKLYQDRNASVAGYTAAAIEIEGKDIPSYFRTIRAAFLGSFTIQGLPDICIGRGIFHNLRIQPYLAPYNQFTQEVVNASSGLAGFDPQIAYVMIDAPDIMDTNHLQVVIQGLLQRTHARIIFFNFVSSTHAPPERVAELNAWLENASMRDARILVFDFSGFLNRVGIGEHWYTKYKDLGDLRLAPSAFVPLSEELMAFAVATAGNTKKCLVFDLDNTLWSGVVGEDGAMNVIPNRELQEYAVKLYEKGLILAINSKNNLEDALEVFEHNPNMVLKKNHFAALRINWQEKERNIAEIADELNIGTESLVFADDSGLEQERVRMTFPEVAVLPPELLMHFAGFHSFTVTEEDARRGAMYGEERMRKELHAALPSEEEFLAALDLTLTIRRARESDVARASQLTQKTNQFNLATRKYSEDEIRSRLRQDSWRIWIAGAKDRFGDYGIIGIVMIESQGDTWRIDNFLLSCRVLGRKVEE
ncbi:MAG: HAD-IIIC family phosphatase, partial [Candidatus Sungbacteria bacterium]|nr:HAD-IIIC family phosphatase [Candidatus Sungbacteria bacterium]